MGTVPDQQDTHAEFSVADDRIPAGMRLRGEPPLAGALARGTGPARRGCRGASTGIPLSVMRGGALFFPE